MIWPPWSTSPGTHHFRASSSARPDSWNLTGHVMLSHHTVEVAASKNTEPLRRMMPRNKEGRPRREATDGESKISPSLSVLKFTHTHTRINIGCTVKTWSKNSLFLSQNLVQVFSVFFFFCFSKIFFFLQGEMRFLRKTSQKKEKKKNIFLSQNLVQLCCATYLDQVLTQPWTKFWLNIFANFWVFLAVWKDAETTIFIVFSAKKWNF